MIQTGIIATPMIRVGKLELILSGLDNYAPNDPCRENYNLLIKQKIL